MYVSVSVRTHAKRTRAGASAFLCCVSVGVAVTGARKQRLPQKPVKGHTRGMFVLSWDSGAVVRALHYKSGNPSLIPANGQHQ